MRDKNTSKKIWHCLFILVMLMICFKYWTKNQVENEFLLTFLHICQGIPWSFSGPDRSTKVVPCLFLDYDARVSGKAKIYIKNQIKKKIITTKTLATLHFGKCTGIQPKPRYLLIIWNQYASTRAPDYSPHKRCNHRCNSRTIAV